MGATGSTTRKAAIRDTLLPFTKWSSREMKGLHDRSQLTLSDTFALRFAEFEFLLGREQTAFTTSRDMFHEVLDTDKNRLVDKFEGVLLITLLSSLTNAEKVEYMFELLNFNDKGYLTRSELSLLLRTMTQAAQKADPAVTAPSNSLVNDLIDICFDHYCVKDAPRKANLRKPELVKFAAETVQVQRYLDSWRGHASQVLLPAREKWRDAFFPCNESSIAPTHDWFHITDALPAHFVYWRRKERVLGGVFQTDDDVEESGSSSSRGASVLFTHKTGTIKSVDKRKRYTGPGAVGNGVLLQGLLADRWLLNGVACCLARPAILPFLFATTAQESRGRFCVRVFEGGGWRSIFIDDRIPCAPDFQPLYAHSSDSSECWPLLLEKTFAKYFGSYGHIGLFSLRIDAAPAALRLLTGGHVMKEACADFVWNSVASNIDKFAGERDGFEFVANLRAEGSIVAFGRSEGLAMHDSTLKHSPRQNMPHGFLFPVVNNFTREDGYKMLVLRDGFGHLVPPTDPYDEHAADEASGHCHIYTFCIEDLLKTFDTLIVCRFPDALRVGADRLGWRQWHTVLTKDTTAGPSQPAKFMLSVSALPPVPPKPRKERSKRLSKMRERTRDTAVSEEDVVAQSMFKSFNYARPRMVPGETGTAPAAGDYPEDDDDADEPESEEASAEAETEEQPTSLALTVSSSCEWAVAGSPEAGAKLRLRIVPTLATLKVLRRKEQERLDKEAKRLAVMAEQKRRQAELLAAAPSDEEAAAAVAREREKQLERERARELGLESLGGQSEETKTQESPSLHAPPTEAPKPKKPSFAEKEQVLTRDFFETRLGNNLCWSSQSLSLWAGEYYVTVDVSFDLPRDRLLKLTKPADLSEAPWLDNRPHRVDEIWAQVSSCAPFSIAALPADQCPTYASSVASVPIPPARFPFSFETPKEAASRGIDAMLSRLKLQAEQLDAEYSATRASLKKMYKAGKRANII